MDALPAPAPLAIHDANVAELWTTFQQPWEHYAAATEVAKKSEKAQVGVLMTVMGAEGRAVFATFTWADQDNAGKMKPVMKKFEEYCQKKNNVPFERYRINSRQQGPGETYEQYRTQLLTLTANCAFGTITPDEILPDRLVFGISDDKLREKLFAEKNLTG